MNRDDSTITSLRELLALETARIEAQRQEEAARVQARVAEAQRAREEAAKQAELAQARELARLAEVEERIALEARRESERAERDLQAKLRAEQDTKLAALEAKLAEERAAIVAINQRAAAARSRSNKLVGAVVFSIVSALGVAGFVASSRIDASIRASEERAAAARAAEARVLASTPSPAIVAAPAVTPTPAPIVAEPAVRPVVRPRPAVRPRPNTQVNTPDPFSQLSNIDRGANPINGTDR
ncbi:MAG: hypothetical protein JNK05_03960 [Myxococcales bacterium]|nr:hypothetical protein [Myxococcales bacterium]